jgi:hypothetical protein
MIPPSRICSEGGDAVVVSPSQLSPVHIPPCLRWRTLASLPFALSNIAGPPSLLNIAIPSHLRHRMSPSPPICVVECRRPLPFALSIVVPPWSHCQLSSRPVRVVCRPASPWVVVRYPHPFALSVRASITPYEQWLAGRVVALCDMALGMVRRRCSRLPLLCCCPEWDPLPPCKQRLAAAM